VYCDYNSYSRDKICYVDPKEWRMCSSESKYGYRWAAPCIFLKLNKVSEKINFEPLCKTDPYLYYRRC
jgi:hypothetical protein